MSDIKTKEINDKNVKSLLMNLLKIFIYEDRNIKIDFKFDDQYEDLIKYLKSQKIMI